MPLITRRLSTRATTPGLFGSERLLTPEIVSRLAVHLKRELDAQMRNANGERSEMETLAETRRRIAKFVKQIEEDDDCPHSVMTRLKDLERERSSSNRHW